MNKVLTMFFKYSRLGWVICIIKQYFNLLFVYYHVLVWVLLTYTLTTFKRHIFTLYTW